VGFVDTQSGLLGHAELGQRSSTLLDKLPVRRWTI
jgi:hypothetical protein